MLEQIMKDAQIARIDGRAAPDAYRRIYFIEAVGLDAVKIGYATHLESRLMDIQVSCPVPVRLLGTLPGGRGLEQAPHAQLAESRIRGEWFRRDDDLESLLVLIDPPETADQIAARL